jgi:aminoglycoside phosphotransferase (APT) family kinase protein
MHVSADAISPDGVLDIVNSLRQDGMPASFCFGTQRTPLSGKQCWVYAVHFPDKVTWAVRIPAHTRHLPPEAITGTIEEEASILKRLERGGFTWSPKLVGYCSGFDNPIAFPYIVLTWIHGTPLCWTEKTPPCRGSRDKLLGQVGRILVELAECSQDQGMARPKSIAASRHTTHFAPGTGADAVTYLTDTVDRKMIRALDGRLPGIDPQSCLLQRALVRKAFRATADPMLISHEDLDPSNIIVDEELNVKG